MEENKNYELDEELEEEYEDDENFEDEDFEEDESEDDEDAEDEALEDEEVLEDEETDDGEAEDAPEGGESVPTGDRAFEERLLRELGYSGTYDEARAAFEAEHGNGTADNGQGADTDYDKMATDMLNEINEAYGLKLTDFSKFENLEEFANLSVDEKYGAVKAFAATNHKLIVEGARKAAIQKLSKPQRNVPTLPKSDGGKGGVKSSGISRSEIKKYGLMHPGLKEKEIIKLIKRVHKS